jgi:hypothetical protein
LRGGVLECGCGRQPSTAVFCRMDVHSTNPHPHALESGEVASLHRRTPKRGRHRMGLPELRVSVLECGEAREALHRFGRKAPQTGICRRIQV